MRPKQHETTGSGDLFRARLEQIINMKHELVQLAGKLDWEWIDGEIAPLYSDQGRPGVETRFVIGLLLLKHIYGLSDEGACERWVHDPYFQYLSHWRKRLGDKLDLLLAERLRVAHQSGALRTKETWRGSRSTPRCICGRPSPRKVFLQCFDQIACVHMSGLSLRSHMNAGQDGFRDARSKQPIDLYGPLYRTGCLASGTDRSHHLLVTLQVLASAQHGCS
jgi:Transposase domain (DUF772)